MAKNRIRLTNQEYEFVRNRYKEIDLDNLFMPAEGLSSLTNLDMLAATMKYDLDDKNLDHSFMEILYKKVLYFKNSDGRNFVERFNISNYIDKANKISQRVLNSDLKEIYQLDQLINYIRNIEDLTEEEIIDELAMCLGTAFGELVLVNGLLDYGYDWDIVYTHNHPVICDSDENNIFDPIDFMYTKLSMDKDDRDMLGTCSDLAYDFEEAVK